jgi:hypothetical protein
MRWNMDKKCKLAKDMTVAGAVANAAKIIVSPMKKIC